MLCLVLWLTVSEVSYYMETDVNPVLSVSTDRQDKLRINLDIYLPNMPCSQVSVNQFGPHHRPLT